MGIKVNNIADVTEVNGVADIAEINGVTVPAGGIALVQSASGTTADGSLGLTVPFGAAVVSGAGTSAANGTYTFTGNYRNGRPQFNLTGTSGTVSALSWDTFHWIIYSSGGVSLYSGLSDDLPLPFGVEFDTTGGTASPPTVVCSSPVTTGNSVIALISDGNATGGIAFLVGGGGEEVLYEAGSANVTFNTSINAIHNVASGVTGVIYTASDAVRANNIIAEYSGLADAAAEDTATNTATSTTLAIGTITPTSANNLLTAIFAFNADVTVVTPPAGWTLLDARQGGASVWEYVYYKIQTSADADNPTIVLSGSADIAGAAAAFGGA